MHEAFARKFNEGVEKLVCWKLFCRQQEHIEDLTLNKYYNIFKTMTRTFISGYVRYATISGQMLILM